MPRSAWASLPIVVVLPVPLTPTTRTTAGFFAGRSAALPTCRDLGEQLDQPSAGRLRPLDLAALDLGLEPADDIRGRAGADVGHDQRLLEPLPGFGVERLEERGADLGAERLAAGREALAQAPEEAAPLGRAVLAPVLVGLGDRGSPLPEVDQLCPARRHGRQRRGRTSLGLCGWPTRPRARRSRTPRVHRNRARRRHRRRRAGSRAAGGARSPSSRRPASRRRRGRRRRPSCASGG